MVDHPAWVSGEFLRQVLQLANSGSQIPWHSMAFHAVISTIQVSSMSIEYLVGGLEHFSFSHILGIVIPVDEHIFFNIFQGD